MLRTTDILAAFLIIYTNSKNSKKNIDVYNLYEIAKT